MTLVTLLTLLALLTLLTLFFFFYICCNPQGGARVCVYWTESIYISIVAPIAPDPQVSSSSALLLLPGSNLSCER